VVHRSVTGFCRLPHRWRPIDDFRITRRLRRAAIRCRAGSDDRFGFAKFYQKRLMCFVQGKPVDDESWVPTMEQFLRQDGNEPILGLILSAISHPSCSLNLDAELRIPGKLRPESIDPELSETVVVASGKPTATFELQSEPKIFIVQDFVALAHLLAERCCSVVRRE